MALEYFTHAWESKSIQHRLLAVAPITLKEAVQSIEEYLASSGPEHTPRARPVEQTELPAQPSALEISARDQLSAVCLEAHPLDQLAAHPQACLATSE